MSDTARELAEAVVFKSDWGDRYALIDAALKAERSRAIKECIRVMDHHCTFDPYGVDYGDGSRNGIIKCTDSFRADLDALKEADHA